MSDSILDGFITRAELARQVKKSERTLARWEAKRYGPPVTYIGQTPYYQTESARRAFIAMERKPTRANGR